MAASYPGSLPGAGVIFDRSFASFLSNERLKKLSRSRREGKRSCTTRFSMGDDTSGESSSAIAPPASPPGTWKSSRTDWIASKASSTCMGVGGWSEERCEPPPGGTRARPQRVGVRPLTLSKSVMRRLE